MGGKCGETLRAVAGLELSIRDWATEEDDPLVEVSPPPSEEGPP